MMAADTVGFIGLGNMGIPMTQRLVGAGFHVRGFDTAAAARDNFEASEPSGARGGATAITELGAVGDGADAVILMLPDSDIVERVLLGRLASEPADRTAGGGLLVNLAPGTTVIDMSSSDPARTRVLAELGAAAGRTLIDAPVSGGVAGARAGPLMIMVGVPFESSDAGKPMLS